MKTPLLKLKNYRIPLFFFLLTLNMNAEAQPMIDIYTGLGSNNVSHGLFVKSAAMGNYKFGKNSIEAGFQTNLRCYHKQVFSGYTVGASRDFTVKGIHMGVKTYFTTTIFSSLISETNFAGLFRMNFDHFEMNLGTNFRTFSLKQKGIIVYETGHNTSKIHETPNIMYSFCYNLKPSGNKWNTGISITNFDNFTINQETNPMFKLHGSYKLNIPVTLYAQAWYQIAGASNLEVNYFGFYLKTGIIWNL